jgi:membrane-bound lytic murein transglycosylase D
MPATGKSYLIVTENIDERNAPLKATLAAAEIFKENYRSLKQWPLAVTAYNHGPAGVRRALRASKTDNLVDLVDKYHEGSFKFASANFYTSFLAALHAEKYHNEIFGEDLLKEHVPLEHTVLSLDRPMKFKELAKKTKVPTSTLLKYNLDLRTAAKNNSKIPRGYNLVLPPDSKPSVLSSPQSKLFKEAALTLRRGSSS